MPKNENCVISDSTLCRWINKDCSKCYINDIKKDDDARKVTADFEAMLALLPPDYDELQGDECQFCIGEKGKRSSYANVDFAHSEPKSEVGMFFGLGKKVRRKVGSYVLSSISICRRCRMSFFLAEMLKWILPVIFFGVMAAILTIPAIVAAVGEFGMLCLLVAAVLVGYIAGMIISKAYVKSQKERVRFDVFDIPVCAQMKDRGWFLLQDNQRFIFSKKPQTGKFGGLKKDETNKDETMQTTLF